MLAAACSDGADVTQSTSRPTETTVASPPDSDPPTPTDDGGPDPTVPGSPDTPATTVPPEELPPFEPAAIDWERFDDAVDVGTLDVPVDYAEPDGATFELFLARYNALDQDAKIGTLLVNPGGPGFGGTDLAFFASQIYDRPLRERFDIIGWDPRGTGESDPPIDCIDDYDPYVTEIDATPDTPAERRLLVSRAEQFAEQCVERSGDIVQHVGTNASARDMDTIRRSLGEDRISYFGFSYGSELGATWATLFPDTVRAAVLDGASDPDADALESSIQQLRGFESTLSTFLARCSEDDECVFHNDGDAEGALDRLLADLDAEPIDAGPERPPANRDVAITALAQAMYSERFWPELERSLAAAQEGDGSGLLALHDSYYQRSVDGTYGNELEAFQTISCADTPERPTIDEIEDDAEALTEAAPRFVPDGTLSFFCSFFPPALDPRLDITAADAGPIVVIGTTGDPATPFESTERMADKLEDGRLVVVDADQHTGYGLNRCVIDVVNDYLVDLEPPDDGTECG
jgi:pimeloyl-ACP methyl ester carboxylesterase